MASVKKGGINPYISAINLGVLCGALSNLSEDALLMLDKNKSIITIGSRSKGWLGFIDIYNEEIVIYGEEGKPLAKDKVTRLNATEIRKKKYPKPKTVISIIQ